MQQFLSLGFEVDNLFNFHCILEQSGMSQIQMQCESQIPYFVDDIKINQPNTQQSTSTEDSNQILGFQKYCSESSRTVAADTDSICKKSKNGKKWLPAGKKADKSDPELNMLSSTYFWERRNILLQILDNYLDDNTITIKATPKYTKSSKGKKVTRPRGSQYRGVSKNKAKWQVMIMGNFKKMYFGAIKSERDAAVFYDKLAIVSHGIKAKTNFDYSRKDIIDILNEEEISNCWNK
mmetsp:Transcript_14433/g.12706  ORF Transcript_14433/g.12706 Transcript_14433/m.12706 type:complete len:236 (-) Transcript_14433:74-781(-)